MEEVIYDEDVEMELVVTYGEDVEMELVEEVTCNGRMVVFAMVMVAAEACGDRGDEEVMMAEETYDGMEDEEVMAVAVTYACIFSVEETCNDNILLAEESCSDVLVEEGDVSWSREEHQNETVEDQPPPPKPC